VTCDVYRVKEQLTAADVVNHMSVDGLREVLRKYGEERHSKLIAHAIVDSRYAFGRITTTTQLANIVTAACDGSVGQNPTVSVFYVILSFIWELDNSDPRNSY